MKRILSLLIASLIAVASIAQEHLSFKGIPITGSMVVFCSKLRAKGFTKLTSDKTFAAYKGDFTGREATAIVSATPNGMDVFGVTVLLDESGEWNTLIGDYSYYKDLYTRKYGEPSACMEENPSLTNGNIGQMHELQNGRVTWASAWELPGGSIELSVEKSKSELSIYKGLVVIKYRDSQNVENKIQQDLNDI